MTNAVQLARWLCGAALLLVAPAVRADAAWLAVRGEDRCVSWGDALLARVSQAIAGERNPALSVAVELSETAPMQAVVRFTLGARELGTKTLEVRGCSEALDAVAVVVALALSSLPPESLAPAPAPAPAVPVTTPDSFADGGAHPSRVAGGRQARSRGEVSLDTAPAPQPNARGVRVLVGVGVDLGTLARPTLLVAGGAALALGRAELRALGRYGVPSTVEEAEVDLERLRADFGAASLDACWGLDRARWLSACGGLELSLSRSIYTRKDAAEARTQERRLSPAFGPLAGLTLVLRDVPGQPQLELFAQLPLAGRAPAPGFRATLGGGLLF